MSGLSASADGAAAYDPATSTATLGTSQATDVSACLITLPVSLLVSVADVEIYGTAMTSAAPMVDCSGLLPVSALFNADPALSAVNFAQDPSDPNGVIASIPAGFNDQATGDFAKGFDSALQKPVKLTSLDANAYLWWNDAGKSISSDPNFANPNSVLYKYANFPQFVVAKIAYDIFGHPMAQAGIANDTEITGQLTGTAVGSTSLGVRLAAAFKSLTEGQLQAVYEQMLQQDPARFKLEDASGGALGSDGQSATSLPRSLPFKEGDKIRFEVILDDYDVKRVALNSVAGNSNTSKSGSTLTSEITMSNAQAGQILTTRYAGMRVTVQMALGTIDAVAAAIAAYQATIEAIKIERSTIAANAARDLGGNAQVSGIAAAAAIASITAYVDAAYTAALTEGKSEVEAWAAAAAAAGSAEAATAADAAGAAAAAAAQTIDPDAAIATYQESLQAYKTQSGDTAATSAISAGGDQGIAEIARETAIATIQAVADAAYTAVIQSGGSEVDAWQAAASAGTMDTTWVDAAANAALELINAAAQAAADAAAAAAAAQAEADAINGYQAIIADIKIARGDAAAAAADETQQDAARAAAMEAVQAVADTAYANAISNGASVVNAWAAAVDAVNAM